MYQVLVGQLPTTLDVDDGSSGPIPTGKAPGILGVDARWGRAQVALAGKQRVATCMDGGGAATTKLLAAGYFLISPEVRQELGSPLQAWGQLLIRRKDILQCMARGGPCEKEGKLKTKMSKMLNFLFGMCCGQSDAP